MFQGENIIIHIGLPKTGTTFLKKQVWYQIEANTLVPRNVDPGGSGIEFINTLKTADNMAEFRAGVLPHCRDNYSSTTVISHENLSGGMHTPADPEVVRKLKYLFPDARIILCLREQFSHLESVYTYSITKGFNTKPMSAYAKSIIDSALEKYAYHKLINIYQEQFGAESVKVLLYEELKNDPQTFVEELCAFCHVPPPIINNKTENASLKSSNQLFAAMWLNHFLKRVYNRLLKLTLFNEAYKQKRLSNKLHQIKLNMVPTLAKVMPPKERLSLFLWNDESYYQLLKLCQESNRKVELLINRDLRPLKYL